jgi:murein hydrolase activator
MFLLVLFCQLYCFNSWADNAKPAPSKEQLSELQQQIQALQKNLNQINQSKNSELNQLKKTDLEINQLVRQIYQLDQKIDQLEKSYKLLDKDIQTNQQSFEEHQKILAGQLTASYHIGQQEFMKLLLNQQNPAIFGRVMSYYQYFHQARITQIDQVSLIISKLSDQRNQLQLLQQEIELQQYLKNNEKSTLQEQQLQRNILINNLSKQQQDAASKLKQLEQDEQQLKKLLETLQRAAKKIQKKKLRKPFSKSKGRLKWPLRGKLKKLYGHWRSINKVKWKGNIILSPEGQNVYSISHGTVVYSDWLRGYGLLTIIDHGKGYMSLYGYSQALLKSVGDQVEQGEVIATAGRTSGRSKAGIYFEIRYNGKPTNPARWCKKMPK